MNRPIPKYISPACLYASQKRVELVCGFYGPKHPKCKKALDDDDELYRDFLTQFKIPDEEEELIAMKKKPE